MMRRVADEANLESLNLPCQLLQQYVPCFRNRRAWEMRPDPTTFYTLEKLVVSHHKGYGGVKVGSREIIGLREEGRRWNTVIATGE